MVVYKSHNDKSFSEACKRLREFGNGNRLTPWECIMPGKIYHIPPLLIYDRRTFLCESVENDCEIRRIRGKMIINGETNIENAVIFESEISSKFLIEVKNWKNG